MTEKKLQADHLQDACYDRKETQKIKLRRNQKLRQKEKIAKKPKIFPCEVCGEIYSSKTTRDNHFERKCNKETMF